jgi:hypothetical protein
MRVGGGVIRPAFGPGEIVSHITDETEHGVIVAFMARGHNHSYEVQWGVSKLTWHLDFELVRVPGRVPKSIGFWSDGGAEIEDSTTPQ